MKLKHIRELRTGTYVKQWGDHRCAQDLDWRDDIERRAYMVERKHIVLFSLFELAIERANHEGAQSFKNQDGHHGRKLKVESGAVCHEWQGKSIEKTFRRREGRLEATRLGDSCSYTDVRFWEKLRGGKGESTECFNSSFDWTYVQKRESHE